MAKLYPNLRILTLRGCKVILDSDLAAIYGVTTKRLNQQLSRNRKKFPDDFAFQLAPREWNSLRLQIATSSFPDELRKRSNLRLQIATSSSDHGGRRHLPYVFTEHGALQAANVLNSPRAVTMSVYVIRAFIKLREQIAANQAILKRLAEIEHTLLAQDGALRDIYEKLLPLLAPPAEPPKPEIGFHVKEDSPPYRIGKRKGRKEIRL